MLMLTTIVEMKGLSSSHHEKIWNEQLKSMMGMSFKGEKSSASKIAMVNRILDPGQEVGPDLSLDLDPRGGLGVEVALDPSPEVDQRMQRTVRRDPNPDPNLEVDPRMQRTVRRSTVTPDPGPNPDQSPEVDPRM